MYRRITSRPDSKVLYSIEMERKIAKAMGEYLAGTGPFQRWEEVQSDEDAYDFVCTSFF
jgi:hypothetical protein